MFRLIVHGIRDAAGPHGVPDAVYLGFEFAGDHRRPSLNSMVITVPVGVQP